MTETAMVVSDASKLELGSEPWRKLFNELVAPGAKPEEVNMIVHYAKVLGLDPFRRQVMLITMGQRDAATGKWVETRTVIVGVHGLITKVQQQDDFIGMASAVVYPGEKCIIKADGSVEHDADVVKRSEHQMAEMAAGAMANESINRVLPVGSWCQIRRLQHGQVVNYTTWLPFMQVSQWTMADVWVNGAKTNKKEKRLRSTWGKQPDWMNEKCAIAFSARKAYGHILGGVYVPEEVGARTTESGAIVIDEDEIDKDAPGLVALPEGARDAATMDHPMAKQAVADPEPEVTQAVHDAEPEDEDSIAVMLEKRWELVPDPNLNPEKPAPEPEKPKPAPERSLFDPDNLPPADKRFTVAKPNAREDLLKNLVRAGNNVASRFNPPRSFLFVQGSMTYICDFEVLSKLGFKKATSIEAMTDEQLIEAHRVMGAIETAALGKGRT